jgi:hypothetical protein
MSNVSKKSQKPSKTDEAKNKGGSKRGAVSEKLKKSIKSPNLGGRRPGAGMPRGTKIKRTIEKETALREYRQRIMEHADQLFNSQYANAVGNVFIYRIEEKKDKKGNLRKEHVLVTDPQEVKDVLDGNDGGSGTVGGNYYLVTTAKPDNYAITDMLDRAFGKPTQHTELTGKDGGPIEHKEAKIKLD